MSAIVANWNGGKFIRECLRTLLATDLPGLEVIVVDEASDDGSYETVRDEFAGRVTLLRNDRRVGLAPTFNRGLRAARGEFVAFLHNDTVFHDPTWLRRVVQAFQSDPSIGAAQPKMLWREKPEMKLGMGWDIDQLGYPVYTEFFVRDDPSETSVTETFIAWDGCLVARRSLLSSLGAFEESFATFEEDYDLAWRVHLAGYKVVCVRSSRILHQSAQTAFIIRPESVYNSTKNHLMIFVRNMGTGLLVTRFPTILSMTVLITAFDLIKNPELGHARVRGIRWLVANRRTILQGRMRIQHDARRVGDGAVKRLMKRVSLRDYYYSIIKPRFG